MPIPMNHSVASPRRAALLVVVLACVAGAIALGLAFASRSDSEPAATALTTTTTTTAPTTTTTPPPPVPVSTDLASPNGEIAAYDAPGGAKVDTVGVWYGYPMTMPILEEQEGRLRIMMPERPNGLTAWVQANQVTRSTSAYRMVLKLSETRVYVYKDGYELWSAPVGIGKDQTRTPVGSFFVAVVERDVPGGYGPIVVDTNAHSEDIQSWQGSGDAITAFHGPFGSEEILRAGGGKVSNGCLRMLPEDQIKMDGIPLGTPVDILA
jgi:lipoprotein-anchoring transpeptidase ErfK/SrfK